MAHIRIPRPFEIPGRLATPEAVYLDRRRFLATLGAAGLGAIAGLAGCGGAAEESAAGSHRAPAGGAPSVYPAHRNPRYVLDRPLTEESVAAAYNNFYEFTEDKEKVAKLAELFPTRPWTVEITGLVARPRTVDIDDLVRRMPLEERLYRHRCVEAWAMAVPWTGFPMDSLLRWAEPLASARYVRMVSFLRPEDAPGQKAPWYPWPYFEALSLAEATNPLTLLATGIYGHELPPQHGAPIRLVTPWKYGFKSIKSIARIELTAERPGTFWNVVAPAEYDFTANVEPEVPHLRWSQASERMIGTEERRPTIKYNGYGEHVAHLYGT